ncbi:MAG: glycosyltransferase, partial [Pseudomonadota bacterium]
PGCVMRSDILRLELMARVGGVYLDTDIKPVRPLDACCPAGVSAWVACEQREIISNAAMGFVPKHPAAWRGVNAIEESFFERRYVGDQSGPGLVARVMLEHDDVILWPPACFHPRVGETIRNPDLPRLLMQAHLFAGTWVEGRQSDHRLLWQANSPVGAKASDRA